MQRFVLVGGAAHTYGLSTPHVRPLTEESPTSPGDYYGTSNVLAEQLVQRAHQLYGLEYTIVRHGWVLAPNEVTQYFNLAWARRFLSAHVNAGRRSNLWPLFAGHDEAPALLEASAAARTDNPAVILTGPGGQPWAIHFTDVRDLAAGIALAIDHKSAADELFNIAGPRTCTFAEGAAVLARHCKRAVLTGEMPVTLAYELSTTKARDLLGYMPAFDFDATMDSCFQEDEYLFGLGYVPVGEG